MPSRLLNLALLIGLVVFPVNARPDDRRTALAAASRDLCSSQIAVLGETGNHGSGETLAFKVALVEHLVRRCGFTAVLFESSFYDFAELARRPTADDGERRARIASSIGRLWTLDREFDPLLIFLNDQVAAGRIKVAGLDYGIGSAGAFYSLDRMPEEFVRHLPLETRNLCHQAFGRRIRYDYPDDQPYSPDEKAKILGCIDSVEVTALATDPVARQMLANFRRAIEPDFGDWAAPRQARGAAMFDNLQWHLRHSPPGTRTIVWTATLHGARSTAMDDRWRDIDDLGARISRIYGNKAFVLGFAAAGGTYLAGSPIVKSIEPAPSDSLETVALGNRRTVAYLSPAKLAALGTRSAAMFMPDKRLTARWRDAVDGVVVFRTERPPVRRAP